MTNFQGQTVSKPNKLVVDIGSCHQAGMCYVMLSRCQSLDQLHIIDALDPEKIHVNEKVKSEAARMEKISVNKNPCKWMNREAEGLKVCSLNTLSLRKHMEDVRSDPVLLQSDILCLQETWLEDGEEIDERYQLEGFTGHFESVGRGKGLVVYVKSDLEGVIAISRTREHNIQMIKIEMGKSDIIAIYRSQDEPLYRATHHLKNLVNPEKDTLVVGDVNFGAYEVNEMSNYLAREGFSQLVTLPTHIRGGIYIYLLIAVMNSF